MHLARIYGREITVTYNVSEGRRTRLIMPGMGIYDGLKDAASILKEAGKIEQYRQILDVQEKLLVFRH